MSPQFILRSYTVQSAFLVTATAMILVIFSTWQHICYSALYAMAHPSICL